jgi:hypothetical protein
MEVCLCEIVSEPAPFSKQRPLLSGISYWTLRDGDHANLSQN